MRRGLYRHARSIRSRGPELLNDQSTLNGTTLYISCPVGGVISVDWGDGTVVAMVCDGTLKTLSHSYTVIGIYTIRVIGTTALITDFRCYSQSWISGDIAALAGLTSLTALRLYATSVSGDIASVAGLTSLIYLSLYSTSVSGDIASVAGLTSLRDVYFYSTSISGDIAALAGLTSLVSILTHSTSVSGDIAVLAGLTPLTNVYFHSTSVSGDIAALAGLTSLTGVRLYSTLVSTYTSTPLPPWAGIDMRVDGLGLTATELDNLLIDLANGVGAGVDIDCLTGNGPRTAASDAAVAAIIAAGGTVT